MAINNTVKSTNIGGLLQSFYKPAPLYNAPNSNLGSIPSGPMSVNPTSNSSQVASFSSAPAKATGVVKSESPGSYKGVAINPGTQEEIMAQMRAIDNPQVATAVKPVASTGTTGTLPPPSGTTNSGGLSYSGLVGGLANNSIAGSPIAGTAGRGLLDATKANKDIALKAESINDKYSGQIAEVGRLGAGMVASHMSGPSAIIGEGNAAIASQSASQRMSALAAAQGQELASLEPRLAAQAQTQSALTSAGGLGIQGQEQLQSGLTSAAGLAAPSGNYPFVFNPLTGQFQQSAGQEGGVSGILSPQQAAQAVMNGSMSYDQAKSSLGYLGGTGAAQLDSAITGAGGNPLQLQAQGAATQANIGTQTSAQTEIARAGLQQATDSYVQMQSAAAFAGQQSSAVDSILTKTGLNNVSSTDYNKVLNNLQSRFSTEDYAALRTALQEAQFAYSNLLSTGGSTPTTNDQRAISTLDINQSARVIKASIAELENAVARRLQAQYGAMQTYQSNLGGSSSSSGYSGGTGGLYDF